MAALLTVLIWGTTFIATKVLLRDFQPVEILFFRFLLGYVALWLVQPHLLRGEERLPANFFIGFLVAMVGVCLISFSGTSFSLNPKGDILALLAALVWGFYSIFTRKIASFGYTTIQTTRRTFFYGLCFMLPACALFDFQLAPERFADPVNVLNLLFLGLGASALCFVTWNTAIKHLGAIKTSLYIFLTPVITVVCSCIILHEPFTWLTALGTLLTLGGLLLSESKSLRRKH